MGKKNSFLLYLSSGPMVEALPDAEAGQLFKALFRYGEDQKLPEGLSPLAFVAFQAVRPYLDENREKWEHTCAARAEAGRAGGYAKAANVAKLANAKCAKQTLANVADNENEFVSESENDNVPLLSEGKVNGASAAPASKGKKSKSFVKPTIDEIAEYCAERRNGIDPQHFFDYYESNGWMVGKTHMKDWKATVRNWERRGSDNGKSSLQIAPTSYTPAEHIFD